MADEPTGDVVPLHPLKPGEPPLPPPGVVSFAEAFGDTGDPRAAVAPEVERLRRWAEEQAQASAARQLEDQRRRERLTVEEQAQALGLTAIYQAERHALQRETSAEHEARVLREARFAQTVRLSVATFAVGAVAGAILSWWVSRGEVEL